MIVKATDLKNNLGQYLRAAAREEVIITSNGRKIARLTAYEEPVISPSDELLMRERAAVYASFPRKATFEEFLRISENSEERYEYIDGEIYLLASPVTIHQKALGELHFQFAAWFRDKSCRPMLAPYDITLKRNAANKNVVQPDLMVICDLEQHLNEKGYYMGVPSLVVEILSESTRGKDSVKKMDLYLSTGVQEYWIVNPFNREVSVYQFTNEDVLAIKTYQFGDIAKSFIFAGLEVRVAALFA